MDVVLDFDFERGLFFILIQNLAPDPVFDVSFAFDPGFTGLGGSKKMHELHIFKSIPFLAPYKTIRFFMDASHAYFEREEPEKVNVRIQYENVKGKRTKYTITHDLGIYKDLVYLVGPYASGESRS